MGPALASLNSADRATLSEMYSKWPWFTAFVDVVDMVMAKSEPLIAENYDRQLVGSLDRPDKEELLALGARLRDELSTTKTELLKLRGYDRPQQENDILLRGLKVRNPYVDPLNVLQAETLKRLRTEQYADAAEKALLEDALAITINGIANGQKNTG
jgi:phosphoenolpyruvate carboxylase